MEHNYLPVKILMNRLMEIKLNTPIVISGMISKKVMARLSDGASLKYMTRESIIKQLPKSRIFIFLEYNALNATRMPAMPMIP